MVMKTLVLGLGNPILSDDGVGFYVAEELKNRLDGLDVSIEQASTGGLSILDLLAGYDKAIIIDAVKTGRAKAGQVGRLKPEAFSATLHASSPHDLNFVTALELGRKLGMALPEEIDIVTVEVEDVTTFSEKCTPKVEKAKHIAVNTVMQELDR